MSVLSQFKDNAIGFCVGAGVVCAATEGVPALTAAVAVSLGVFIAVPVKPAPVTTIVGSLLAVGYIAGLATPTFG